MCIDTLLRCTWNYNQAKSFLESYYVSEQKGHEHFNDVFDTPEDDASKVIRKYLPRISRDLDIIITALKKSTAQDDKHQINTFNLNKTYFNHQKKAIAKLAKDNPDVIKELIKKGYNEAMNIKS